MFEAHNWLLGCLAAEYLDEPRFWDATGIGRFMLCIGPASSIFDITTFCLLWWAGPFCWGHRAGAAH